MAVERDGHGGARVRVRFTFSDQIYPHGASRFELYEDDGRSNA
jgi:hypothetical protein